MPRSDFVEFTFFNTVTKAPLGLTLIRVSDVRGVRPYDEGTTVIALCDGGVQFVVGKSSEVADKLYGESVVGRLEYQITRLQDAIKYRDTKVIQLREHLTRMEENNKYLTNDTIRLQVEVNRLNTQVVERGVTITELKRELETAKNSRSIGYIYTDYWREKYKELTERFKALESKYDELEKVKSMGDQNNSAHYKEKYDTLLKQSQEVVQEVRDLRERNKYLEQHHQNMDVSVGVGDGTGQLFVYGNYESIKRVQGLIFELESLRVTKSQLERDVENLQESRSRYRKEVEDLKAQEWSRTTASKSSATYWQERAAEAEVKLTQAEERFKDSEKEYKHLNQSYEGHIEHSAGMARRLAEQCQETSRVSQLLDKCTKRCEELEKHLQNLKNSIRLMVH
jgi:chromosome segregation ATPase